MYEHSRHCPNSAHILKFEKTSSCRINATCPILFAFPPQRTKRVGNLKPKRRQSLQLHNPPSELSRRVSLPKDPASNSNHRSSSSQRFSRRGQRNPTHSHQHRPSSCLFPQPSHPIHPDRRLRGLLGPSRKNRTNRKIIRRLTQNSRYQRLASAKRPHNPLRSQPPSSLRRRSVVRHPHAHHQSQSVQSDQHDHPEST